MKWVEGKTTEKSIFAICPKSVYLDLSLLYLLLLPYLTPFGFEITPFLYLKTQAQQWLRKLGFFSSFPNGKGTSLRRGEGGFAAANLEPLILGFLIRCDEGVLRNGEVLHHGEVLRRGEPVAFLLLPFCHFCFCFDFLSFSCPFDSNIAIFYRTI